MAAASPQIHLTTYGYTYEGRPLPLAVIGAPGATAAQVLATSKTRVYIQGNIHAGEVEGKEALLWLLRSIAKGERNEWLRTTVLMINPIYNADGNERVNVTNRGSRPAPSAAWARARTRRASTSIATARRWRQRRRARWRGCSRATSRTSRWTCTRRTAAATAAST